MVWDLITAESGKHHWLQEGFATYAALAERYMEMIISILNYTKQRSKLNAERIRFRFSMKKQVP
jgi:hypothetical protein